MNWPHRQIQKIIVLKAIGKAKTKGIDKIRIFHNETFHKKICDCRFDPTEFFRDDERKTRKSLYFLYFRGF